MIQARYLQQGNLITGDSGDIEVVVGTEGESILTEHNRASGMWLPECNFKPIDLTPEILDVMELEKSPDNEHWFLGHFGFCMIHDGLDYCIKRVINENTVIAYCRYVHQLQNLYYALRGKELPITIK